MLAFPFREGKLRVEVRAGIRALSFRTLPLRDSAGLNLSEGIPVFPPSTPHIRVLVHPHHNRVIQIVSVKCTITRLLR